MNSPNDLIEQQLFRLLRRTNAIHVTTSTGDIDLERSSYGILCLLADDGPQRLGAIAATFQLDPSTVTRQVQAVVALGMARKDPDPTDRRATVLSITDMGLEAVTGARTHRRAMLNRVLDGWSLEERQQFLESLTRFNADIDILAAQPVS